MTEQDKAVIIARHNLDIAIASKIRAMDNESAAIMRRAKADRAVGERRAELELAEDAAGVAHNA